MDRGGGGDGVEGWGREGKEERGGGSLSPSLIILANYVFIRGLSNAITVQHEDQPR